MHQGGFRTWWRRWQGDDDRLDNTHLMRLAGRFARRVRGWARANDVPVIDTKAGERKHLIAQEYLEAGPVRTGVFFVLVARARRRCGRCSDPKVGRIVNLEKTSQYVNHYSFHIMDPIWGHVTIKMSGHPPFGAQVILNGHEYVAAAATGRRRAQEGGKLLQRYARTSTPRADRRHRVFTRDSRATARGV